MLRTVLSVLRGGVGLRHPTPVDGWSTGARRDAAFRSRWVAADSPHRTDRPAAGQTRREVGSTSIYQLGPGYKKGDWATLGLYSEQIINSSNTYALSLSLFSGSLKQKENKHMLSLDVSNRTTHWTHACIHDPPNSTAAVLDPSTRPPSPRRCGTCQIPAPCGGGVGRGTWP